MKIDVSKLPKLELDEPENIGHLVFDWDETATKIDTMHLLGAAAYDSQPDDFQPTWDYFVREYMNDFSKYAREFKYSGAKYEVDAEQVSSDNTTEEEKEQEKQEEINHKFKEEEEFLMGLRDLEYLSAQRAEDCGLFKSETFLQSLEKQVHKVPFRPGWWNFLKTVHGPVNNGNTNDSSDKQQQKHYPKISILSANWSKELIIKTLDLHFPGHNITVYSNSIDHTTGKLINYGGSDVRTADEKRQVIKKLQEELAKEGNENGNKKVWYFGDSNVDILALVEADKRVVVGKKKTFDKMTKELNIPDVKFIVDWTQIKIPESYIHSAKTDKL